MKIPALVVAVELAALLAGGTAAADSQATSSSAAAAQKDPFAAVRESAARIAGAIYGDGRGLALLGDLSDSVGARVSGSAGYKHGAEWVAARLKQLGVADVKMEPFTIEHGWQRGVARGRITAPFQRTLHVESMGWSPATPKGGVHGSLVVLGDTEPAAVQAFAATAKGKIVIYDRPRGAPKRSLKLYSQFRASLATLRDAGALAVLAPMNESMMNNVISTGTMEFGGKLGALPTAGIGYEDGKMLVRALDRGPVTVDLDLPNQVSGPVTMPNVIGEIKGTARPEEWILIGAHLDSWDFATGSQDNGAGVVQVLEAARALIAAGPPRRSIRFAFWGGEEQGLNGSRAYAVAHEAELGKCVAYLNTDNGAGHVKGWKVEGRKDVRKALEPFAKSVLAGAGGGELEMTLTLDTDHFPFVLFGVPALDLLVDGGNYEQVHHQMSDTIDKVDAHSLESGAAVVALTAGWLAMTAEPLAPRLDHAGIEEVLKQEEGVLDMLRARGFWK